MIAVPKCYPFKTKNEVKNMIDVFYFDKTLRKGMIENLGKLRKKKIWLDITDMTKQESELIKKTFNLHPLTEEDLFRPGTRIKVEEFPDYLFCVFYGIKSKKSPKMVEFDLVLGDNFVISNHKEELGSISELKGNAERLERLFAKGIDFIFHKILDKEIDNFFPVLEGLDDRIEAMEEEVTKKPTPELLKNILELKRSIIYIKKHTLSQREKISFLAKNNYRFISEKSLPYFRDVYDHAIRVSDIVDNYREAVGNTFDVYMSAVSNSMNEVMKILSIIATIALPLTVISGIYGTNFSVLPGADYPYGFWWMIILMVAVSAFMLIFFRKRKWF
jgi:magnesium transporter